MFAFHRLKHSLIFIIDCQLYRFIVYNENKTRVKETHTINCIWHRIERVHQYN